LACPCPSDPADWEFSNSEGCDDEDAFVGDAFGGSMKFFIAL